MSTDVFTPDTDETRDVDLDADLDPTGTEPDDDDIVDDEHEGHDETSGEPGAQGAAGTKPGTPQRGLTRGAIRRIATKAEEVSTTPDRIVEITASLLGTSTGLADLTTAIMAAPRGATGPIGDLTMIAESDQFEAAVNATALGKDRLKAVWNLLVALDTDVKGNMPAALPKAAIAIVRPIFALDDAAKGEIAAVASLLKKN